MTHNGWSRTATWWRAMAVAAVGACAAVLTRRPDVLVLVSGFVLAVAMDWRPPGARPPGVSTETPSGATREGEPAPVRHRADAAVDAALTVVTRTDRGVRVHSSWAAAHPSSATRPTRWGVHDVTPLFGHWVTRWGGWAGAAPIRRGSRVTLLPIRAPTRLRALPRPIGFGPGTDPGTRSGDGFDYTGLRLLGDDEPPRRVNWPATLRTGEMVVTATLRDTAGTYLVLVDGSGTGSEHADVVREAAGLTAALGQHGAEIAVGVLGCGDVMPVPLGSGARHVARIERALAQAVPVPDGGASDHQPTRIARLRLPRGTVVVGYSALHDPVTTALLLRLRRSGHRPCVVDTTEPDTSPVDELARRTRHLRLEVNGIPVITRADGPAAAARALSVLATRRDR